MAQGVQHVQTLQLSRMQATDSRALLTTYIVQNRTDKLSAQNGVRTQESLTQKAAHVLVADRCSLGE